MATQRERNRRWYAVPENRAKALAKSKARYAAHRDEINAKARARSRTPEFHIQRIVQKYDVSLEEAQRLYDIQACQICGRGGRIAVDHDHGTGRVRGRLCHRCNRALGALGDDVCLLLRAVSYLNGDNEPHQS